MPIDSIIAGTGIQVTGFPTDPVLGLISYVNLIVGADHTIEPANDAVLRVSPKGATRTVYLPPAEQVPGRTFVIQRIPGDEDNDDPPPTGHTHFVKVVAADGDTLGPRAGNTFRYLSTGSDQLVVQASEVHKKHWIILNTEAHVYDILDFGADPTGFLDSQPACQAASDLGFRSGGAVTLYAPEGWFALGKTWTIVGDLGRAVVLTGVGPGNSTGTCFVPHPAGSDPQYTDPGDPRSPLWNLTGQYHAPQRCNLTSAVGVQYGCFGARHAPQAQPSQVDYKPLIRTRKLYQGSYIRNLTLLGIAPDGKPRCGKAIWVDWWFAGDVGRDGYTASNGLRIENVSIGGFSDVSNVAQPHLPAFAVQVGAYDSTGDTLQAANVRLSNVQVNGGSAAGKTDVGLWYHTGNVKNFVVADSNFGGCRYAIRTAGSGYFLITGCDFSSSGRKEYGWGDGADFLIPQAFVTIAGCGSEGSRRSIIGEGLPGGGGAVTMIGSYWAGVLPFDWDANQQVAPPNLLGTQGCYGAVVLNINQSFAFHGCRFETDGGGWDGQLYAGASRVAWDLNGSKYVATALLVEGCHIEGQGTEFADPDVFVSGFHLVDGLGKNPAYDNDFYRLTFRHNYSNDYDVSSQAANPPVRLANFEHGSGKRLGGNARKVQQSTQNVTLGAYNDVILLDASSGPLEVMLPPAKTCRGREYVVVKVDDSDNPVDIKPYGPNPPDPADICSLAHLDKANPRAHLLSAGSAPPGVPARWIVIG